jgi:signal transduction histidine kinase/ActR/RegA family two-component response regulator
MFLFDRIDFIALVGLWVQTFVAWVFVAILGRLGRSEAWTGPHRSFYYAFLALSAALSIMSVRFFRTHDAGPIDPWVDGGLGVTLAYSVYLVLKAAFGFLIVRACHDLAGQTIGPRIRLAFVVITALLAVAPVFVPNVTHLLIVQAPVMIGCATLALRTHSTLAGDEEGRRLVRHALIGLIASWSLHAISAMGVTRFPVLRVPLAFNSLIDLAVQLTLGVGLIVSTLQDSHRRMRQAEQQRERLELELARDSKLRALGTLVSGVAHEINNPLTVILGYAELLGNSPGSSEATRTIAEQARRCRDIVRNLSALAGQTMKSKRPIDASELLGRVMRGLDPQPRAQDKRICVEVEPGLQLVADCTGMEQVLSNIIANALDACRPGGEVSIEARTHDDGVELSITDDGPGIPREVRERLFEPFFTTKAPGHGTGLGLAIAHAIVQGHGGKIEVHDRARGSGTRFAVWLPKAAVENYTPETRPPVTPRRLRRLSVLDDDNAVRSVLRHQAELRGWIVAEFPSAESALDQVELLERSDAILCDLRMPGRGGVGIHDQLEAGNPYLLNRMVFATGDLASADAVRFSRRCRRPLIEKPFDFEELFASLDEVAHAHDSAHGSASGFASDDPAAHS